MIDATVCIKYGETLRVGNLRFSWLQVYKEISQSVNRMFNSKYVGDMPVEDKRTISLNSRVVATPMTNTTQRAFELVVMRYVQEELSKKNLTILDVQITGQDIRLQDDTSAGRILQRDSNEDGASRPASTIDVSANINGQYRPPPDIDYSSSVEDAFDAKPQDLDQSLKRSDTYFEIIESISSKKEASSSIQSEVTPPPASASNSNTLLIVLLCLVGVFLLFVSCTWYLRRRQKRRRRFIGPSFVQDSEVLQEKKSLFGGFGKGKQSIMDAYTTADVVWAGSTPISGYSQTKSSMYGNPQSMGFVESRYSDDPEKRVAEQFQDEGTYGYDSPSPSAGGHDSYRSDFSGGSVGGYMPQGQSQLMLQDEGEYGSTSQSLPEGGHESYRSDFSGGSFGGEISQSQSQSMDCTEGDSGNESVLLAGHGDENDRFIPRIAFCAIHRLRLTL